MLKKIFNHRYGTVAIVAILVCAISLVTRIILILKSWPSLEINLLTIAAIFFIGFFYDLIVSSFFAIPVALYSWLMKDSVYKKRLNRVPLFILFFLISFILLLNAGGEIIFWDEFSVRYNFIAVDYLIYTTEVLGNIWESYNIPLIGSGVILTTAAVVFLFKKKIIASQSVTMHFAKRTPFI